MIFIHPEQKIYWNQNQNTFFTISYLQHQNSKLASVIPQSHRNNQNNSHIIQETFKDAAPCSKSIVCNIWKLDNQGIVKLQLRCTVLHKRSWSLWWG